MKKTYIQPSMMAIKIDTMQLVMNSTLGVDPSKSTSTQLGRRGTWDDDEDDEEDF